MKLSSISEYISQSEAAILVLIAEKIMQDAETNMENLNLSKRIETPELQATYDEAVEAQAAAYAIKCVAEQSIMANDGQLMSWVQRARKDVGLAGWIETPETDDDKLHEQSPTEATVDPDAAAGQY